MTNKKRHQSKNQRNKALPRAKEQIQILEDTVRKQSDKIENLEQENQKIKGENERLKKELAASRKPPRWAKPNKSNGPKKKGKKLGPKKGHEPNKRKVPEEVDQEIRWFPLICPDGHADLPDPHKWSHHFQIDLPATSQAVTTKHLVGWSWCKVCEKEVCCSHKLNGSLYGPRLHARVAYWKFSMGLTLGKIHKLLLDQYGLDISTGVLSEMLTRSAKKFKSGYEDLKTQLSEEKHLHADESVMMIT